MDYSVGKVQNNGNANDRANAMSDTDLPAIPNQQPAAPTLTPAEQALATTIVQRILAALLASPTTGQYVLWAVRWVLALAGAKVSAVTDNQVAQVAGWIVTAAMLYLSWKAKKVHVRQAQADKPLPTVAEIKQP